MPLFGRYFSQRDINLVNQFNAELMRDIILNIIPPMSPASLYLGCVLSNITL